LIITLNLDALHGEKPDDGISVSQRIGRMSLAPLSLPSVSSQLVMHVMTVRVAFSLRTVGCMDDHIELSLSAREFINLAHCMDALLQDQ
jgi:hypothetical protein